MTERWLCVKGPGPQWKRSAALADDGTVFVPAQIACGEMAALLATGWDGTTAIYDDGHLYLPVKWIRENYPEAGETCDLIERKVIAHFLEHPVSES